MGYSSGTSQWGTSIYLSISLPINGKLVKPFDLGTVLPNLSIKIWVYVFFWFTSALQNVCSSPGNQSLGHIPEWPIGLSAPVVTNCSQKDLITALYHMIFTTFDVKTEISNIDR